MHESANDPILILSGSQHLRRTIDFTLRLGRHRSSLHSDLVRSLELIRDGRLQAKAVVLDAFLLDPATLAVLTDLVSEPPIPMILLAGFDLAESLGRIKSAAVTILVPPFTMASLAEHLRTISDTGPWSLAS